MDDPSFWDEDQTLVGPPLSEELITYAVRSLGYTLPASYLALLRTQNGGYPRRTRFDTKVRTSWAEDHIAITSIKGIGGTEGIDSAETGTRTMIREWGYPEIGVVVCDCPSAGHDVVMLDYRACGPGGEPSVVHVETEGRAAPVITPLAPDFATFLRGLRAE